MKSLEELYETLSGEIKRELAQSYFSEKITLEKTWESFSQGTSKEFFQKKKILMISVCQLVFMLNEESLIAEFERITGFPLKICYSPEILESTNIKRKIFSQIKGVPFGFTSKSRFVKLFLKIYENLYKAYQNYMNTLKDFEEEYTILKKETENFHKRYDISSILGFFEKLEEESPLIRLPQMKEDITSISLRSLTKKL